MGLPPARSDVSVRFSFGRFTTDADAETAADLVLEALEMIPG